MSDIRAYQLHPGGTPERMQILLREATSSANNRNPHTRLQPSDWRGARLYTLKRYQDSFCSGLHQGFNDKAPVWYSHAGQNFRNERYCDEVHSSIEHTGWYCDVHQDSKARGIVANLPHGRYISGYELSDSEQRVYFPEIFSCEVDAARMADEHARIVADGDRDYDEKFQAASELSETIERIEVRLCECFALRNNKKFKGVRAEIVRSIITIRKGRETLESDFAGVL